MSVEKSFWDYFWLAKFHFQTVGIFPIGGPSSIWKSILTAFLGISPLLYGQYIILPEMNYILFSDHSIDDLLEAIIVVVVVSGGQLRILLAFLYRHKIVRMLSYCKTLWDSATLEDRRVMSVWIHRAQLFGGTYFFAGQLAVTLFVLTSSVRQFRSPENSTARYYPFTFQDDCTPSLQYEIKYTIQIIIGYTGTSAFVAADIIGTLLTLNMCGQMALIRNWLSNISERKSETVGEIPETKKSVRAALRRCIRRHQVVLDFCAELEEVTKYLNLIQIVTGMYVIAIAGARIMKNLESYRYFGLLLSSICALFFSCWPATSLSSASNEIAVAVYEIPWYCYSPCEKATVAMMLARSQRSTDLTAGKFVPLSLETFTSIVSSALSFCMVLSSF